jgi:hypothetical protein
VTTENEDRFREAIIVAIVAIEEKRYYTAIQILNNALDGTGFNDGRETARIIARLYRQLRELNNRYGIA